MLPTRTDIDFYVKIIQLKNSFFLSNYYNSLIKNISRIQDFF